MSTHGIRGLAALAGVSALVFAGPATAAAADSDLQTIGEQPSQEQVQPENGQEWSLDDSKEPQEGTDQQDARLGSLGEDGDTTTRDTAADDGDTAADDGGTASGPGEDFCDAAFADNDDAHAQCMQMAESVPSEDDGGEGENPFQQFCDEAFADNEDAHAQCTEFASNLAPEDEGDGGEDDTTEDDGEDGEDDSTGEDGEEENPFQQFCDEAFADNEDAHAQCTEFAGNFEQDEGGEEEEDPFQQFCDEAFADNEDAHAQCTEFAQALAGEEEDDGEDDPSDEEEDTTDEQDDTTDEQDESGTLDESQTASPAADDGALPVTGLNVAIAGLSGLSLLGMGGALLRRFRADSLG